MGYEEELRLSAQLAALELPDEEDVEIVDADGLLAAIVAHSDSQGRYYADPRLLRRLFWWQETDAQAVRDWRDELVARGDLTLELIARNCYSPDKLFLVACLQGRKRFWRFADRPPIPDELRLRVYARDGFRCLHCGTTEDLSLDHIYPFSLGGPDTEENLQTLCRSCNSRKGNRIQTARSSIAAGV